MQCTCDSFLLFHQGCRCGAFKHEISDHIWFNGVVYVIARNADQAGELALKDLSNYGDFTMSWVDGDFSWQQIDDDDPVTIATDKLQDVTHRAREWIQMYGKGYLASG